jgi:hypothetical protein
MRQKSVVQYPPRIKQGGYIVLTNPERENLCPAAKIIDTILGVIPSSQDHHSKQLFPRLI